MLAARVLFPAPPAPSIATSTVPGLLRRIVLMRSTTSGRAASSGMHRVSRPEQPGPVRGSRRGGRAWSATQLRKFLVSARTDRFYAPWVLEATSGMRRCELAGARRDHLDLER